ncbi:MAG TPA: 2Fe-2S iron-sulfur cluster-binding protein, partial [Streptosporangiaceae bacterium]|nr:2Fe-2S iron-sulfur cluster-binding protein [Streptosporangiaceae bacterium]
MENTGRRPQTAGSVSGIVVNGERHELSPAKSGTLLALLRSDLGLTGAKPGCGEGECGACTVLLDGRPVLACQTAVAEAEGRAVTTVEGLADRQRLHPVQQALATEHGFQCGYCTPAMALRAAALLAGNPDPDDAAIAAALEPNVCRCGCYPRITRAVRRAAVLLRDPGQQGAEPVAVVPAPLARPGRPWDLCSPRDREWFDVLGDGLVVVWPPPGAHGGAWVHLSPSGTVTAFTGKVDVGQDNGAAFRLLVAEELAVDPGSVRVVQGDTDLCPSDIGTFGSRSMPDAGEWLRRAAAGAREALLDLAARRWRAGDRRTGLGVSGGAVTGGPGGARLAYRELLTGLRRLDVLDAEPPLTPPAAWRIAGYRPMAAGPGAGGAPAGPPGAHERLAGDVASRLDVVTGARRYASDQSRPGMRYGAVLRPLVRGARLRAADTEAAAGIPGVTIVREGEFVGAV